MIKIVLVAVDTDDLNSVKDSLIKAGITQDLIHIIKDGGAFEDRGAFVSDNDALSSVIDKDGFLITDILVTRWGTVSIYYIIDEDVFDNPKKHKEIAESPSFRKYINGARSQGVQFLGYRNSTEFDKNILEVTESSNETRKAVLGKTSSNKFVENVKKASKAEQKNVGEIIRDTPSITTKKSNSNMLNQFGKVLEEAKINKAKNKRVVGTSLIVEDDELDTVEEEDE